MMDEAFDLNACSFSSPSFSLRLVFGYTANADQKKVTIDPGHVGIEHSPQTSSEISSF